MRPSEPRNFCDMSVCGRRVGWRMVYVQCVEIVPREQRCRLCGIQWCSARVERTNFRFLDLRWHRHELRGHTHHTFSKPHGTRFLSISCMIVQSSALHLSMHWVHLKACPHTSRISQITSSHVRQGRPRGHPYEAASEATAAEARAARRHLSHTAQSSHDHSPGASHSECSPCRRRPAHHLYESARATVNGCGPRCKACAGRRRGRYVRPTPRHMGRSAQCRALTEAGRSRPWPLTRHLWSRFVGWPRGRRRQGRGTRRTAARASQPSTRHGNCGRGSACAPTGVSGGKSAGRSPLASACRAASNATILATASDATTRPDDCDQSPISDGVRDNSLIFASALTSPSSASRATASAFATRSFSALTAASDC